MSGSHLLSHAVARIVPSAVKVLTVVFGMGTGVSPSRITTGQIYQITSPWKQMEVVRRARSSIDCCLLTWRTRRAASLYADIERCYAS